MPEQKRSLSSIIRFIGLMIVGVGITIATGLVHGRLTQRWGPPPDLQAAARGLQEFPKQIGDWQMVSEEPLTEPVVRMLNCAGSVNRRYVNRQSGQTVSIAVIVGPPGPTAVHTPEICYSSRAYEIQDPRKSVTVSDGNGQMHSFWSLGFRSNNSSIDRLQVYYGWRANGAWTASQSPRIEFAGERLLYKLQLAALVPARPSDKERDPCEDFLSALLRSGWDTIKSL
jgi:Protein of unknown function (DUF3485)